MRNLDNPSFSFRYISFDQTLNGMQKLKKSNYAIKNEEMVKHLRIHLNGYLVLFSMSTNFAKKQVKNFRLQLGFTKNMDIRKQQTLTEANFILSSSSDVSQRKVWSTDSIESSKELCNQSIKIHVIYMNSIRLKSYWQQIIHSDIYIYFITIHIQFIQIYTKKIFKFLQLKFSSKNME